MYSPTYAWDIVVYFITRSKSEEFLYQPLFNGESRERSLGEDQKSNFGVSVERYPVSYRRLFRNN